MKRKRFSVEQIVAIVKQAEMGLPVVRRRAPLSTDMPALGRSSRKARHRSVCQNMDQDQNWLC
jgi:hypothetical protein